MAGKETGRWRPGRIYPRRGWRINPGRARSIFLFALLSSYGQAQAKKNKQCADRAVENCGDSLITAQTLAESGRKERENQTPSRAGNHKRKAEGNERGYFRVGCWVDELREERQEEKSDFRIEDVGQNSLTKRSQRSRTVKI